MASLPIRAQGRVDVLARHLLPPTSAGEALTAQPCAATQVIRFARPAALDVRFGRPTPPAPPASGELEALGRAAAVLSRLAGGAAAPGAGGASPSAGSPVAAEMQQDADGCHDSLQSQPDFPRFARAVPLPTSAAATSPFAVPPPPIEPSTPSAAESRGASAEPAWPPDMRVSETVYGWCAELALPGVQPEDLRVELAGRELTVSGVRPAAPGGASAGLLPDLVALLPAVFGLPGGRAREEAPAGSFTARWLLPAGADVDTLAATFQEGVLRIRVARS